LIELLKKEEPPSVDSPLSTCTIVDELVTLDAESSLAEISQIASAGNLRALQVLAGSKHEAARKILVQLLPEAKGPALRIALNGLAQNWPNESVDLFVARLGDPDVEIVQTAINGLANTDNADQIPRILPLTAHENKDVCEAAAEGIEYLGARNHVPAVYAALLKTKEVSAARPLVDALISAKWKDSAEKSKLAEWLASVQGDMRYQVIRLLRHLSDNAMGPDNYSEFENGPEDWVKKWTEWAKKP